MVLLLLVEINNPPLCMEFLCAMELCHAGVCGLLQNALDGNAVVAEARRIPPEKTADKSIFAQLAMLAFMKSGRQS